MDPRPESPEPELVEAGVEVTTLWELVILRLQRSGDFGRVGDRSFCFKEKEKM